jgi:hypothetical protein
LNTAKTVQAMALRLPDDPQRVLPLETAANVRDVGGYVTPGGMRTCWGMLLRGGRLTL